MLKFDLISIFSHALDSYFGTSILKRAREKKLIKISTYDLRKYTTDKHHKIDDRVYGGGAGMVMKVEPIVRALHELKFKNKKSKSKMKTRTILLAANGKQFTQKDARRLAKYQRLIFICGRYEGIDARVEKFIDEKISIGPYVLTGGELPAAIIVDAVSRMIPGVIGKKESVVNESFSDGTTLEHPQYTRPEVFVAGGKKYRVPKVLLGGHHKEIQKWRSIKSQSIK
ncbi:MAG: tRNA (guanosine(37)-N1)-methyltransferase TrmD [Patescibacteria group bacterium]